MKPSSAKQKGRLLQLWVRDHILLYNKKLTLDDVRSTGMGQTGADIQLSAIAKREFPFGIECKSHAREAVQRYYEQAEEHVKGSKEPLYPLVVLKENGKDPLVVVEAALFIQIWRGYAGETCDFN